jgi:hypothetical protein
VTARSVAGRSNRKRHRTILTSRRTRRSQVSQGNRKIPASQFNRTRRSRRRRKIRASRGSRSIRDSHSILGSRGNLRNLNIQDSRSIRGSRSIRASRGNRPIRCLRRRDRLQARPIHFSPLNQAKRDLDRSPPAVQRAVRFQAEQPDRIKPRA